MVVGVVQIVVGGWNFVREVCSEGIFHGKRDNQNLFKLPSILTGVSFPEQRVPTRSGRVQEQQLWRSAICEFRSVFMLALIAACQCSKLLVAASVVGTGVSSPIIGPRTTAWAYNEGNAGYRGSIIFGSPHPYT